MRTNNQGEKILIHIILAAIATITLASCGGITKMSVGKPELKEVQMTSFTGALVILNMPVSNPTSKNLEITAADGSIFNDGIEVAQFSLAAPMSIPAGFGGKVEMKLNARLVSLTAASGLINLLSSGDVSLESYISSSTIPATITYTLGSRTKSKHVGNLLKFAR